MKRTILSYVLLPVVIGMMPWYPIVWLSNGYLIAEASLISAMTAFFIRHRWHKQAQKLGETPFVKKDETEGGYVGFEKTVNSYFMKGNIFAAIIMACIYIISLVSPQTISWFGVAIAALATNLFIDTIAMIWLKAKKIPVKFPEVAMPPQQDESYIMIMDYGYYSATGHIIYNKVRI